MTVGAWAPFAAVVLVVHGHVALCPEPTYRFDCHCLAMGGGLPPSATANFSPRVLLVYFGFDFWM